MIRRAQQFSKARVQLGPSGQARPVRPVPNNLRSSSFPTLQNAPCSSFSAARGFSWASSAPSSSSPSLPSFSRCQWRREAGLYHSFSSTALEGSKQAQKPKRRLFLKGVGAVLAFVGIAAAVDEGFRRCVQFWVLVLPMYGHYVYVDKISHPKRKKDDPADVAKPTEEERSAAFEVLHQRYSPIIERATRDMRGFYLKAAQICSMRDDFLPETYLKWTRKLQNEAPVAVPGLEARRYVAKQLGLKGSYDGDVSAVFSEWQDEPLGSASIGQVFRAKLRETGQDVAVKVQSPGIEHLFRLDIRTLKFFTSFAMPWAVENMNAIERMFESEFDYMLELKNMEAVRAVVLPSWGDRVKIPEPFRKYSTPRVLTMELLQGEKLVDGVRRQLRRIATVEGKDPVAYEEEQFEALRNGHIKARSPTVTRWKLRLWSWWRWIRFGSGAGEFLDLAEVMETLLRVHGEQVLKHGVFNADPHPGNILLLKDGKTLGLIDFGQVMELEPEFRRKLANLYIALANRDPAAVTKWERECGMETTYQKQDVRFRVCSFWMDRDTEDILQDLNLPDFMAWAESQDPVLHYPEDLYLVSRCSFMIRSLALAFGVQLSTAQYWRPYAEDALRELEGKKSNRR
mmetsp:Transcript_5601/g.13141  ORF Transcript_5601/g.13141 Transcript_5601/m.13141 type:complete len:626 (-) Transcript_5601:66-1943(-)